MSHHDKYLDTIKSLQEENSQLEEKIIQLQRRLITSLEKYNDLRDECEKIQIERNEILKKYGELLSSHNNQIHYKYRLLEEIDKLRKMKITTDEFFDSVEEIFGRAIAENKCLSIISRKNE